MLKISVKLIIKTLPHPHVTVRYLCVPKHGSPPKAKLEATKTQLLLPSQFFLTIVGAVFETQPPAGNLLLLEGHLKISHLNNNLKFILSVLLLLHLRVMVVSSIENAENFNLLICLATNF